MFLKKSKAPANLDNVYKAYISSTQDYSKSLNALKLDWELNQPRTLKILVLNAIVKYWIECPEYFKVQLEEDKNYLLENINVNHPIQVLSKHIQHDILWKRCFVNQWRHYYPKTEGRKWISIYMEKFLAEYLENLEPCDYDQEELQRILDICATFVIKLDINYLLPSMGQGADHIPFDHVLPNLPELRSLRITFDAKTIGTNYYLGCCSPSKNDIVYLSRGLQKCYDLIQFNMHSTKMEPQMLQSLARSLEKGNSNLIIIAFPHCRIGDLGFNYFLSTLSKDSFPNIQNLELTNNLLSQEAALVLSRTIPNRRIRTLNLRMNPIGSDGCACILTAIIKLTSLKYLDMSACSITESIGRILMKFIIEKKSLLQFDLSNNNLGQELGKNIYQIIGFNKSLKCLDVRNTGITNEYKNKINRVLFGQRDKL